LIPNNGIQMYPNLGLGFPFLKLEISKLKMEGLRMVYAT
jgi:hypothetical protein